MGETLVIYSTVDGHTREICSRIRDVLQQQGEHVTLVSLDEGGDIDPAPFERIVIGASIRYGKHRDNVVAFINRHAGLLQEKRAAFFSVNLVARKPNRDQVETNPYLKRFLGRIRWQPETIAVFAGKLDYPKYRFWDRQMIRFIMWMTKGPTRSDAVVDYTDWRRVEAFARDVGQLEPR